MTKTIKRPDAVGSYTHKLDFELDTAVTSRLSEGSDTLDDATRPTEFERETVGQPPSGSSPICR